MHFVLLTTDAGLRFLSPLGLFCGLVSIVSGVTLYSQHQEISQGSAGEGVRELSTSDQHHLNSLPTVLLPHRTQAQSLRVPIFGTPFQSSQGHVFLECCSLYTPGPLHPPHIYRHGRVFGARLILRVVRLGPPVQARPRFLPMAPLQKQVEG